jgi:hypothetical protein
MGKMKNKMNNERQYSTLINKFLIVNNRVIFNNKSICTQRFGK